MTMALTQITTGGVDENINIDSNTLKVDGTNNRVGIGTTSPADKLHISNGAFAGVIVQTGRTTSGLGIGSLLFRDGSANNAAELLAEVGGALVAKTGGNERLRIDSSGDVELMQGKNLTWVYAGGSTHRARIRAESSDALIFENGSGNSERLRIDSSGNIKITFPDGNTGLKNKISFVTESPHQDETAFIAANRTAVSSAPTDLVFATGTASGASERMRIDSSGRVGIGTTSPNRKLQVEGASGGNGQILISTAGAFSGTDTADLSFRIYANPSNGNAHNPQAQIQAIGTGDYAAALTFKTAQAGSDNNAPTERMRIGSNGYVYYGNQTGANPGASGTTGLTIRPDPLFSIAAAGNSCMNVGRNTNDGTLINFYQAGTAEGSISVSGNAVSYNGAHLSRWSQLPGGAERTEIFRGSVLSNLDEMCEWGEEDNEQLNRMQVSTVEGDKNVSGVFQAWDDDDDTYVNDFYCAMTGDFVIRIAQGTTVARGDLLMSAGDGTAKPQDDDIVRSKTIAKVTSTTVSTTYSDGSYCVPCVLMAC